MVTRFDYTKVSPDALKAFHGVSSYVARSGLPATLVNLVYLRVSQINGCAYCIDMHSQDLLKAGMKIEKLVLVSAWHEAGKVFTPREQIALAWAEAVTHIDTTHAPDNIYSVTAAEFTEKEMSDLTIAISLINAYNRLAISFQSAPVAATHQLQEKIAA